MKNKKIIYIVLIIIINITLSYLYSVNAITVINETEKVATVVSNSTKEKNPDDSNASLSKLVIDEYDMYPEFNKNTTKYYVTIPKDVKSLDVEAEAEVSSSTVKTSGNTSLTKNENTISVVVTAKDKTARKYTIVVTKQDDNGLYLEDLKIEGVELEPSFSESKYYYKADKEIIKENDSIPVFDIKATPNSESAEIEILGNENLKEGENIITILLKDGSDYTSYQVSINITTKTMITSFQDAENGVLKTIQDYYNIAKEKVIEWFSDENRKMATIIAGGVVLFIVFLAIIIKIFKRHRVEKKAEKIKRRAK